MSVGREAKDNTPNLDEYIPTGGGRSPWTTYALKDENGTRPKYEDSFKVHLSFDQRMLEAARKIILEILNKHKIHYFKILHEQDQSRNVNGKELTIYIQKEDDYKMGAQERNPDFWRNIFKELEDTLADNGITPNKEFKSQGDKLFPGSRGYINYRNPENVLKRYIGASDLARVGFTSTEASNLCPDDPYKEFFNNKGLSDQAFLETAASSQNNLKDQKLNLELKFPDNLVEQQKSIVNTFQNNLNWLSNDIFLGNSFNNLKDKLPYFSLEDINNIKDKNSFTLYFRKADKQIEYSFFKPNGELVQGKLDNPLAPVPFTEYHLNNIRIPILEELIKIGVIKDRKDQLKFEKLAPIFEVAFEYTVPGPVLELISKDMETKLEPEHNKLYLRNEGKHFVYTTITPKGDIVYDVKLDTPLVPEPFYTDSLYKLKKPILEEVQKKGHVQLPEVPRSLNRFLKECLNEAAEYVAKARACLSASGMQLPDSNEIGNIIPAIYKDFFTPILVEWIKNPNTSFVNLVNKKAFIQDIFKCAFRDRKVAQIDLDTPQYVSQLTDNQLDDLFKQLAPTISFKAEPLTQPLMVDSQVTLPKPAETQTTVTMTDVPDDKKNERMDWEDELHFQLERCFSGIRGNLIFSPERADASKILRPILKEYVEDVIKQIKIAIAMKNEDKNAAEVNSFLDNVQKSDLEKRIQESTHPDKEKNLDNIKFLASLARTNALVEKINDSINDIRPGYGKNIRLG